MDRIREQLIFLLNFIKREKHLSIAWGIVLFFFIFSRALFFISVPIPGINYDSIEYFGYVSRMFKGEFPSFNFVPPGTSLLSYFCLRIFGSVFSIIVVQNLFTLCTSFLIVYAVKTYHKWLAIFTGIAISISIADIDRIRYDTTLLTESFYINGLILIVSFLLLAFKLKNRWIWIGLSLSLCLPIFFRPQGIYLYGYLVPILGFMYMNKFKFGSYCYFLGPFMVFNLFWSGYNKATHGTFIFGAPSRYASIVGYSKEPPKHLRVVVDTTVKIDKGWVFINKKTFMLKYLSLIDSSKSNFYTEAIPKRYNKIIKSNYRKIVLPRYNSSIGLPYDSLNRSIVKPEINSLLVLGYESEIDQDPFKKKMGMYKSDQNFQTSWIEHFFFKANILWTNVYNLLFRNIIWRIVIIFSFVLNLIWVIKERRNLRNYNFEIIGILAIFQMIFGFVIVGKMSGSFNMRYIVDVEYLFWIYPIFTIPMWLKSIKLVKLKYSGLRLKLGNSGYK